MATSLATPSAAPDGGGASNLDIYSDIGATLQSAITETGGTGGTGEDTPGGEAGTEPAPYSPAQEETPGGEGPTGEGTAVATDEPFPLSEDGKSYLVPKTELADFKGLKEYSTEVQQWFPSVSDARAAQELSTDFTSMKLDYESGDPGNIDRTLQFWAGANATDPYTRQRFQESFVALAQRAPQLLQQINPQAHQQLSRSLAIPFIDSMYAEAAEISDPANQKEALRNAQATEYAIRKGDPQFTSFKYSDIAQLPKHDPNAIATRAQQQAEQDRLKSIAQRENQLLQRDFGAFNGSSIDGKKTAEVWSAIDTVLAPIKAKYDDADYAELRTGVMNDLAKALKTGPNADWWGTHMQEFAALQRMFEQCWRKGQDPASVLGQRAQYYINDLLVRARRVLPSIAAPRISKATGRQVAATTSTPKNATAQQRTQSPPPASAPEKNGNSNAYSNFTEDPEFTRMFKV